MPNIGGRPREANRILMASVVHSQLLYIAPVWATALNNHATQTLTLTLDTMAPLMLQSEGVCKDIESFITLVIRTKVLDGRRKRSNGEGQSKSHWGLRPRSRVPSGPGCHAGGERDLYTLLAGATYQFSERTMKVKLASGIIFEFKISKFINISQWYLILKFLRILISNVLSGFYAGPEIVPRIWS